MYKNPKTPFRHGFPFLIFILLTLILTYPAILKGNHSIIGDYGDSLFNAWILAWDVHKIVGGEWFSLFDANIFYPHKNTLAYSEHMLGNALIALPVLVSTGNPVLAYNFTFLVCLFLSAWGMYLLVFYLTQDRLAALISGIIFGFFPWRFAHLSHVQLQATQWLPLAFLYGHRFFETGSYRPLLWFTLFFVIQFLTCGYYGLYLALFILLLIIFQLLSHPQSSLPYPALALKLGTFLFLSALFILPVYYPYLQVKKEMGFSRSLNESIYFSADLLSYLNTTKLNLLWGKITQVFWKPEGELFLGVTAISLGIIGIFVSRGKKNASPRRISQDTESKRWLNLLRKLLIGFLALDLIVMLSILFFGGISTTLFGIKISAQGLRRPFWILIIGTALWFLLSLITRGWSSFWGHSFSSRPARFYCWMLMFSVLFSLGPVIQIHGEQIMPGPYVLLFKWIPGFDGLRVPARFIVMVALSLSVLAGYGIKRILVRYSGSGKKILLTAGIAFLIVAEYASFPILMLPIEVGEKIPLVYQWLAKQKGAIVLLELPLPDKPDDVWKEAERVYFSSFHWKKMVNGYSGYFPPLYDFLYQKGLKGFPSESTLDLVQRLRVTHIIIHFDAYEREERSRILDELVRYRHRLKTVADFGKAVVFELRS